MSEPLTHATQQALWHLRGRPHDAKPRPVAAACDSRSLPHVIYLPYFSLLDAERFELGSISLPTCPTAVR